MKARILIADDLPFIRLLQKEVLTAGGYEVAGEAADGPQALALYEKLRPDVVVLDITMPGMNGLEVMKRIIALDPGARVIICSAIGQQALILQAIQAGVKDFIVKPFKPERLADAIAAALAK